MMIMMTMMMMVLVVVVIHAVRGSGVARILDLNLDHKIILRNTP